MALRNVRNTWKMEVSGKEKELIRDALSGSQAAFASLLSMYWTDVYSFLASRKLSPEDAEDLCIETFSKAFEKLGTYDSQYRFKTWLINIAKHNHIDFLRKNEPLLSLFSEKILSDGWDIPAVAVGYDTPETELINNQTIERFAAALEYLSPRYRQVMRMRYVDDMSVAGISQALGISVSNVKVILMRARRVLMRGME